MVNSCFGCQGSVQLQNWQGFNGQKFVNRVSVFKKPLSLTQMHALHLSILHSVSFKQCMFKYSVYFYCKLPLTLCMFFIKRVLLKCTSPVQFKIKFQFAVLLVTESLRANLNRWKSFSLFEPCECVDLKSDYGQKSVCKICGVST